MKKIIFVNSHPIQYFAPLYKYLNNNGLKTKAWYCSDYSIKGGYDKEFGIKVKWDIPLLNGYEYSFFKNFSSNKELYTGFFGLINLGMIRQLFREPKSVIIVHGWNFFSHFLVLLLGKIKGHTICLRSETPLVHEQHKHGLKQRLKQFGLKYILFPRVDYFLYIGMQNKLFFKSLGIKEKSLLFCPYSIDNERFSEEFKKYSSQKHDLRDKLGILDSDKVILYSGKYIDKKRPMDLLKAFGKLAKNDCWLIMVGEGELRSEMEKFIEENQIDRVILTGFVNQSKIPEYYALSDVFVMCSSLGETWGLSANEAMNFNLPIILSDLTGSSFDLVEEGINGYVFETGNVNQLSEKLSGLLYENNLTWSKSSQDIIMKYSYGTILDNLNELEIKN
ncbi:glycosyltransferase involved in cell wall biosynthesis [Mariniflexile fucanivorans]|uniref:Glycosyltransferase involved in cell wall biosynthesis n=1 Tax=Mariniflexile fucanivorans TaxID=264023 RepID=A0A4R1RKH9_9FLAO|nr:glycosyltransferase family 4 protein [Mariniflexile fucanivorans]TCL66695.1 glycosyltransferase involved in cell wall biosynthesis [Mariniflexile fucanivorans]